MSDPSDSVNAGQAPAGGEPSPAPSEPPTITQTPEPPTAVQAAPPVTAPADSGGSRGLAYDRPEVLVGGAFAGGILLALILKRLGS